MVKKDLYDDYFGACFISNEGFNMGVRIIWRLRNTMPSYSCADLDLEPGRQFEYECRRVCSNQSITQV